uniref:Predicted protein n=1 Tax=Hordeum vulgare subsp. vulgare TaxID=112509 RepID=F2E763_HORVV|nr:predicted protein [Hordeum vulgare subsp. vulgare]
MAGCYSTLCFVLSLSCFACCNSLKTSRYKTDLYESVCLVVFCFLILLARTTSFCVLHKTNIDLNSIFVWFELQDAEEAAEKAEAARKRAADIASGTVQMNGRELFLQEPWVFDNNIY